VIMAVADAFTGWSKKLVATLVAMAIILLNRRFELGLDDTEIWALVGVAGAYTVGQGLADVGKSKALLDQKKPTTTYVVNASVPDPNSAPPKP